MTITDSRTQTLQGRLKAARVLAGMEQADMAAELGVSRQTISNWEVGRNEIPATAMIRWAELTRISIAWLGFGTVRPEGFEPPAYCSVADDVECGRCHGSGMQIDGEAGGWVRCTRCEGTGNVPPFSRRDLVLAA